VRGGWTRPPAATRRGRRRSRGSPRRGRVRAPPRRAGGRCPRL